MVLGGGGIRGGQAIGDTDKDGIDIVDQPVSPMDGDRHHDQGHGTRPGHPVDYLGAVDQSNWSTAALRSKS